MKYDYYLAGPISGDVEANIKVFAQVAQVLRDNGWTVFSPPEDEPRGLAWSDYLRRDLPHLAEADAVCLLPGWQNSKGAQLEKRVAEELGMPCDTLEEAIGRPTKAPFKLAYIGPPADVVPNEDYDRRTEDKEAIRREAESQLFEPKDQRQFSTGSVRDASAGKGRMDLLPGRAILMLAKWFESGNGTGGAIRYGDRNWEKGQPIVRSYFDSGLRHAFKALIGRKDEDHLVAACWNFMCALDTRERISEGLLPEELNDFVV